MSDIVLSSGIRANLLSLQGTASLIGQTPLAYLTWWRLTTAARLLRGSDAPLSAVAARTGYGSEYAFASAFKRQFGTPPGRYRRCGDPADDSVGEHVRG